MSSSRTVLITGANRGLGRAMTAQFIEAGHTVLGCARSADAVAELAQAWGDPHCFVKVDVSIDAEVQRWAEQVRSAYPPPDLLLNNAAIMNRPASLWELEADEFGQLVDVNVKGVFHVIRHFLPGMIERGRGIIVNFSSGWGRSVAAEVAPYCCSKWGIEGLTRSLAEELPEGLAAIPLNPGIIATDMLQTCFGAAAGAYPSPVAWARRAVPFLLELTPGNNGQPLTVPS